MDRPHGQSRWAFLLVGCVALFAVALVPRGVVRATVASERGAAPPPVGEHLDSRAAPDRDLPGVRVVVSREERDTDAADVVLASSAVVAATTDAPEPRLGAEAVPLPQRQRTAPSSPRAPPTPI